MSFDAEEILEEFVGAAGMGRERFGRDGYSVHGGHTAWERRWARIKADPWLHARLLRARRAQYRRQMADPEQRERTLARARKYRLHAPRDARWRLRQREKQRLRSHLVRANRRNDKAAMERLRAGDRSRYARLKKDPARWLKRQAAQRRRYLARKTKAAR